MQFIDLQAQYQRCKGEIDRQIQEVLDSSGYILGPKVKELEEKLAAHVGVKHAVGVASGTDALLICLMALGIGAGDEVITSAFSFFATAEVISLLGAKPVFIDIDPSTYNIDSSLIENKITPRTKAIMPVSLYGQCADMKAIVRIADKHSIPVIEDACQSFGAVSSLGKSGGISSFGCTSFYPAKPLGGYGEGGMVFTNDSRLAESVQIIRHQGQERSYYHTRIGVNGRLDAIQAAILLGKWPWFPEEVRSRQLLAEQYRKGMETVGDKIVLPRTFPGNTHVYAQFSIQVENRARFIASLKEMGIPTAIHYPCPLPFQPVYSSAYQPGDFPVSESVSQKIVSLPFHPYLKDEEREKIIQGVIRAVS
jgi:UDP-2-acetamido-2-deoxy-ribo-hexuluronate aminotransferase